MLETPTIGIARLLSEGNAFNVPHHQRNYSWTEDEIETLFRDLSHAMSEGESDYFIGLMVFIPKSDREFTILDGQQRLVTTVITLSAVRSWLKARGFDSDAQQIQAQFIAARELGSKDFVPRIVLNEANNPIFRDYVVNEAPNEDIEARLKSEDRYSPNRKLLEAILFCREKVHELAAISNDHDSGAQRLFSLVKYFERSVKVVRLHVPNESNAYTVFETLNDRGLDLSVLDLVKNHIFGKASDAVTLKEVQAKWTQMMGNLTNARGDDFLKVWWTSRNGRVQIPQLFSLFKSSVTDRDSAIAASADLFQASDMFSGLEVADDTIWGGFGEKARKSIKALKLIGAKQGHPILLSALGKFYQSEIEKLLWYLEVLFVRYQLIGGGRTGRLEIACAKAAQQIWAGTCTSCSGVMAAMKELLPSDSDFKLAFESKQERGSPKARYLLTCLENQAKSQSSGGGVGNELEVVGTLTLEHILPKSPDSSWTELQENDEFLREECTHRLGNMCLLTNVNQKLGSGAFEAKKSVYKASKLELTSSLDKYTSWGRSSIENRQKRMANLAAAYWRV